MRWVRVSLVCCAAMTFASGCQKSDADALASIGARIAEKGHVYAEKPAKCSSLPGSLESRVRQRMSWDKTLADNSIEVVVDSKNVELKGTLATPEQVRRAVDLAESTVGVDNVTNSLRIGERGASAP